jgi:inner membrane protein
MPSAIAHAAVAVSVGCAFPRNVLPARTWALGALCACVPDLDVLAFGLGIPYNHPFGHRGFFHGIFFSVLLALAVVALPTARRLASAWVLAAYLAIVAASHGLLDTLTNGGLGIAIVSPFSNRRYFSSFRPIAVSPIGITEFFSSWGLRVILSELVWVGLPCLALVIASACAKHLVRPGRGV